MIKKKATGKKSNVIRLSMKRNKTKKAAVKKKAAKVVRSKKLKPKSGKRTIKKKSKTIQIKKAKPKKGGKRPVLKRKKGLTVVSDTKEISPEQKKELEKLHGILADPFIRQMLIEVGGENALVIVRNFYGSHSDEELSKDLQLRISDVRATLNRLHNEGLVKYVREKDSETGWYSYSWTLNKERIVKWISKYAEKGTGMDGKDGMDYYFCPTCGLATIIEFAEAHECEFKCNKCSKPLEFLEEGHFSSINQFLRKG